jgi:hypothetical protein
MLFDNFFFETCGFFMKMGKQEFLVLGNNKGV